MKKILLLVTIALNAFTCVYAQVGIGTNTPNPSARLDITATNKGLLMPRIALTGTGDITTIPSPATSLLIYNTATAGIGKAAVTPGFYFYNGAAWSPLTTSGTTAAGGWSTTGNAGTDANNFIGTTDNVSLKFRVNNQPAGEVSATKANVSLGLYTLVANTGYDNTAVGYNSLNHNVDGEYNTGVGIATLFNNISGKDNAAFGGGALVANTTGDKNVSIGAYSMYNNQSGSGNVAIGTSIMNYNQSGNSNIAIGKVAAYHNTSGNNIIAIGDSALYNNTISFNVAIGSKALFANTTGVSNTAVGTNSMFNNSIGSQNTALGRVSLFSNTTGDQNTAVGFSSMKTNQGGTRNATLGFQSLFYNVDGNDNTAVGFVSLANNTANDNTAIGSEAMRYNGSGYNGTAIGKKALHGNTTGYANTAVGANALAYNQSGSYNTAIGADADIYGNNYVNATAIGANAQAGCSNCLVLGSVTGYNSATAYTKVGIGTISPQRTLHVNPNGQGGISIGHDLVSGGYTALNMGVSQESGGYTFIQAVQATGATPTYGGLVLNQNGGNVGIRTTSPQAPLHIKQAYNSFPFTGGGIRMEVAGGTSRWDFGIDNTLDFNFSYNGVPKLFFEETDGEITIVSDMRMKKDIQSIETVLPALMKLQPKSYHYKDNEPNARLSYGFLAQEVEKIFPDFVTTKGPDSLKAIGYQKLNVMAIKAIQEQQLIIENQNKRISLLEEKIEQILNAIKK